MTRPITTTPLWPLNHNSKDYEFSQECKRKRSIPSHEALESLTCCYDALVRQGEVLANQVTLPSLELSKLNIQSFECIADQARLLIASIDNLKGKIPQPSKNEPADPLTIFEKIVKEDIKTLYGDTMRMYLPDGKMADLLMNLRICMRNQLPQKYLVESWLKTFRSDLVFDGTIKKSKHQFTLLLLETLVSNKEALNHLLDAKANTYESLLKSLDPLSKSTKELISPILAQLRELGKREEGLTINIREVFPRLDDRHLIFIKNLLPNLKNLDLTDAHFLSKSAFDHLPPSLERLDLTRCKQFSDVDLKLPNTLKELNLTYCDGLSSNALKSVPEGLEELIIRGNESHITSEHVKELKRFTKLRKLGLHSAGVDGKYFEDLPKTIQSLLLSECTRLRDPALKKLSHLEDLHTLDLAGCSKVTDKGLSQLTKKFESKDDAGEIEVAYLSYLRCLNISKCKRLTPKCLLSFPCLTELDLSHCKWVDDSLFANLSYGLELLNLSSCQNFTLAGIQKLKELGCLTDLDLSHCPITDDMLANMPLFLKTLNLSNCREVSNKGLEHLKRCRDLQILDVSACAISNRGVLHLSDSLHTLNLSYCPKVDDFGMGYLPKKLLRLNLDHLLITDRGLQQLPKGLVELSIRNCKQVSDKGLRALPILLEMLHLTSTKITDAGMQFLKNLVCLSWIDLSGCSISGKSLDYLPQGLGRLGANQCQNITIDEEEIVKEFISRRPYLKPVYWG